MSSYNDQNNFSIADLISRVRINTQGAQTDEDREIARRVQILDSNSKEMRRLADEYTKKIKESVPIEIDHDTAWGIALLKQSAEELYDIISRDIINAYNVANGELKSVFPNWAKHYTLKDIDVKLITTDDAWKNYVYSNELDNIQLPGCSSDIVPICIRLRRNDRHTAHVMEIRFYDVICMLSVKGVAERVYMLNSAYVANN